VVESEQLKEEISGVIDGHEMMTRIVYTDTDDRVGYICTCGATDADSLLWGRIWQVDHLTEEITKTLMNGMLDGILLDK
jgi:hypothetical protein